MHVAANALFAASKEGRRYLYRTAAAFVSSRLGIKQIAPITPGDLNAMKSDTAQPGGLIMAGSYVPKTTVQLEKLRERRAGKLVTIELDITEMTTSTES
ncbi:hypothetical protein N7488_002375 [Penicillium malachiteum]|nr:hypothetical protein N7488_002375 [Penicillium malachiteum]